MDETWERSSTRPWLFHNARYSEEAAVLCAYRLAVSISKGDRFLSFTGVPRSRSVYRTPARPMNIYGVCKVFRVPHNKHLIDPLHARYYYCLHDGCCTLSLFYPVGGIANLMNDFRRRYFAESSIEVPCSVPLSQVFPFLFFFEKMEASSSSSSSTIQRNPERERERE